MTRLALHPQEFGSVSQWYEFRPLARKIRNLERHSACEPNESFTDYLINQKGWSPRPDLPTTPKEWYARILDTSDFADVEPYLTEDGFVREVPIHEMEQWYLENMDTLVDPMVLKPYIDVEDFHVRFADEIQARSGGASDVETVVNETQIEASTNYTSESLSDGLPDYGLGIIIGVVALLLLTTLFAVLCYRNKSNNGSTREMRRLLSQSQRQIKTKSPVVLSRMLSSMKLEPSIPEMLDTTAALSSEVEQDQNLPMVFGLVFGSTLFLIAAVTYSTRRFQSKSSVTSKHQAPRVIIAH